MSSITMIFSILVNQNMDDRPLLPPSGCNIKDAILMPVSDLMSRDMAIVSMENKAADKPLLIVSMYFENSKDENGRDKDPKLVITPDLVRVTEYAKDNGMQLLIGADVNAWSSLWFSERDNPRGDILSEYLIVNSFEIHNNRQARNYYLPCEGF